ncbi:MAG TPA: hypothetical protein VIF84_00195 [Candidatus Limnocylindrales bacterium]
MSRPVRRSLEEAGRRPVLPVDPAFATTLEARLLAVAATAPPPPEPAPPAPSRLKRAFAALGVAAVVMALALLAVVTRPVPTLELLAPSNVQVALVDGTILEDPGGLLLPEGAVVTVSSSGSARIGDTLLAPGDVATIHDGQLEIRHEPPIGVVGSPSAAATPRPGATPQSPTPTPAPRATSTAGSASTPPPAPPRPSPRPTTPPAPTATTAAATPSLAPAVVRPRLRVRLVDGRRIRVTWTETYRAKGYVLVVSVSRSGPAADPVYPGSRVLGEFTVPPVPALRYRVPNGVTEVRLMVVALRKDGSVLRRSRVVTVTVPPAVDTAAPSAEADATPTALPTPTQAP